VRKHHRARATLTVVSEGRTYTQTITVGIF